MTTPSLLFALVLCFFSPLAAAGGPIDMGGIDASLGAEKETMLMSLRERYDVEELRSDTYVVFDEDPSEHTIGIVQFRDGKLVWASRDVGAFEGDAVRLFAQTLFQLLADLNPEDGMPVRISTSISTAQPLAFGSLSIEFPGRRVIVDIGYDDQLADASIEEIMFANDTPGNGRTEARPAPGAAAAAVSGPGVAPGQTPAKPGVPGSGP